MFGVEKKYIIPVLGILVCAGIALVLLVMVHTYKKEQVIGAVMHEIKSVRTDLATMQKLLVRNAGDEALDEVTQDCAQREEFDTLLITLRTLSRSDLLYTRSLFDACGDYFSVRKQIMVRLLGREVNALESYGSLYATYTHDVDYAPLIELWKRIYDYETERAQLIKEQVDLQRLVIDSLVEKQQDQIKKALARAQDIGEELEVIHIEVERLMEEEVTLARARKLLE